MTIKFKNKILSFEKIKPDNDASAGSLTGMDIADIVNMKNTGEIKVYNADTMKYERSIPIKYSRDETHAEHIEYTYKTPRKKKEQKFDIYVIGDDDYNHELDSLVIFGEHNKYILGLQGIVDHPYGFERVRLEWHVSQSRLKDSIIYIAISDSGLGRLTKIVGYDVESNKIVLISGYTWGGDKRAHEVIIKGGRIAFEYLETIVISHEKLAEINNTVKRLVSGMTKQERCQLTFDKMLEYAEIRKYFYKVTIPLDLK